MSRITKKFLFVETICKDSPNPDQKLNPDPLRKNSSLLKAEEIIYLLKKEKFKILCSLFKPGKKLVLSPIEKKDFNFIFKKESYQRDVLKR